jgi:hypothetical protein
MTLDVTSAKVIKHTQRRNMSLHDALSEMIIKTVKTRRVISDAEVS